MKYGKRRLSKRIISSPLPLVVLLIAIVVLTRAAYGIHEKAAASAEKLSQAENELAKEEAHESDLKNKVSSLSTDDGIEAELRTKYRAVKDGESVAVIVDGTPSAGGDASSTSLSASADAAAMEASLPWWDKLLNFIGL